MSDKCIFLDRDGVLNKDKVDYVYKAEDHFILPGVVEALVKMKQAGYLLVIITNQSGIAKGLYTDKDVKICYEILQNACGNILDGLYFAPYHPDFDSQNLTSKPHSLMFEKAIAKFDIDVKQSWMIGDKERDLIPATKLGVKTVLITEEKTTLKANLIVSSLLEFAEILLK